VPETTLAPGARVVIRDEEWLVRKVDRTSTGSQAITAVGLSELVKDKEAIFLSELERQIEVLDPAKTRLVADTSSAYRDSLLYMEALLRQTPPTDADLYIGHRGAMDVVPYQLEPARRALLQPRQRLLIADAVGLGKTIEVGILLSELIKRGKARRILVLAVKSMLTQFQKELWSRFTIPLTRLDSVGIQRVRSQIPTNHNPFFYYDKAIISIDTLKQDAEYRTYLENCYWDVIVIDEAHNVAERGSSGSSSLRAKLARLLANRSDTLVMLSATPHDGRARSFASLMNMLDPTAIPDLENYGPEDIQGLFIRRFKKDIKHQVSGSFPERSIAIARAEASATEESVFDSFTALQFARLDQQRSGGLLFKTTLEKALFSSPAACIKTIRNRVARLEKEESADAAADLRALTKLAGELERITPREFSKYQKLLSVLRDPVPKGFGWAPNDPADRLVIFTERIETLHFLRENLQRDLKLKDSQIEILHGGMSDVDQQQVVEAFGKDEAPVRVLVASDVASEGINLHYRSHRMIHFDVPWSLMVFSQRNGRIDRYGQDKKPQIVYLVTESTNEKIRGDTRILELLIQKDEQATANIGDPSALMGVYDVDREEEITGRAIEEGQDAQAFEATLQEEEPDWLAMLMGDQAAPKGDDAEAAKRSMPSLFASDWAYLREAVDRIRAELPLQADFDELEQSVNLTAPDELKHRFKRLPSDVWPENGAFILSADTAVIQKEIRRSRKDERAWPRIHYLWEQHPVLQWANDKVLAAFGRHEAPVVTLKDRLEPDERIFVVSGLIPNRKSQPLIHHWFGVRFAGGAFQEILPLDAVIEHTGLGATRFANANMGFDEAALTKLLPQAVERARAYMSERRKDFENAINPKLNEELERLSRLRGRRIEQLEIRFGAGTGLQQVQQAKKETERRNTDQLFDRYMEWIQETLSTEDKPYLQVVAVLKGAG
jgi:ERCC4-related helicase